MTPSVTHMVAKFFQSRDDVEVTVNEAEAYVRNYYTRMLYQYGEVPPFNLHKERVIEVRHIFDEWVDNGILSETHCGGSIKFKVVDKEAIRELYEETMPENANVPECVPENLSPKQEVKRSLLN